MSVVIPVITGFILFGDTVTTVKVAGIILSLFSFYLIFKPEGKVVLKPEKIILPL
jgi:drug/metabolite transporter (DMT)-like permease